MLQNMNFRAYFYFFFSPIQSEWKKFMGSTRLSGSEYFVRGQGIQKNKHGKLQNIPGIIFEHDTEFGRKKHIWTGTN